MPSPDSLPDWQRVHGKPLFQGLIRQNPSDFDVTEVLPFELSGDGEHDYLWVEKESANTAWVATGLARHAKVPLRDVGYAGLKDRHALTRQWFSVRRPSAAGTDWSAYAPAGVHIIRTDRHQRKLKRGAHSGNAFRILVRNADTSADELAERLRNISAAGVANYFGPQRFGHAGGNIRLAMQLFAGKRMQRDKRSIAMSAARSFLFNEILSQRVSDRTWDQALPGEALNLDGSGSIFVAQDIDDEIRRRLAEMDIHPTAALWGSGNGGCRGGAAAYDQEIALKHPEIAAGLQQCGLRAARRATRLPLRDLDWEFRAGVLQLEFVLPRGSFATAVLREIMTGS